jgi:Holliday junction resolvase RusA-like endonuclease
MQIYNITPVPKPRQTRSDKWKKRPCVMRYRAFADEVRAAGISLPDSGARIVFVMPMPATWSKTKKMLMRGSPHQQKPDIDNLLKALLDSIFDDDAHIWDVHAVKIWGETGMIKVIETKAVVNG